MCRMMRSRRFKHAGSDRILRLPANIVDTILGCLPLRDAVRTSVLSTDWRNRWKSAPKLVFDFHFNHPPLSYHKLDSIIYHVLLQHRGHIAKFALQVFTSAAGPDIDSWLPLLPPARLQDFSLHLYPCSKHVLSHRFFSFKNLLHLNLYRCVFRPPPQFRGFTKLITLDFQDVDFVPTVFARFISLCLLLERVRLVSCTSFDSFVVEAPRLRFFTFQGVFKCIHFKNSPALAEVSLAIHMAVVGGTPVRHGFRFFHFVPSLKTLYLHPRVLEFMGAGEYPEIFNSLTYLDVSMYLDNVNEIASALRLLKNSPQLKSLHVSLYECEEDMEVGVESVKKFIRGQAMPDAELNHIRKVRIVVFAGAGAQVEFVKYVLAAAAKLEELVIALAFGAAIPDLPLLAQLRRLPRASPGARIFVVRK